MIVKVLINTSVSKLNKVYDYKVPVELESKIELGKRVEVSFGRKKDLEEAINDFFDYIKGELWDIKYQVSSSIYGEEQVYCFSAMVIYY